MFIYLFLEFLVKRSPTLKVLTQQRKYYFTFVIQQESGERQDRYEQEQRSMAESLKSSEKKLSEERGWNYFLTLLFMFYTQFFF